jgi:hypothetical protein
MARPSRAEVFDPDKVAIAHVFNRTVRRFFLMGDDVISGRISTTEKPGSRTTSVNLRRLSVST